MGIVDLILKWAVPFVCGAVIAALAGAVRNLRKRNDALENGVQCLLRAEIIREHKEYVTKGYCPIYAKDSLKRSYKAYHDLGGNDVATKLYEDVINLPESAPETAGK